MLVIQKRCNVCQQVKKDKKLLERIYNSRFFIPHSKDNLKAIALDCDVSYRALLVHVKKHQFIDSQDYQEKMLQKADEDATKAAVIKAVKAVDSVQSIIDKGQSRLENGEITVNTDQLLRAAQIKMADEAKQKDQNLMAAQLAFFMSGESVKERVYVDAETPS